SVFSVSFVLFSIFSDINNPPFTHQLLMTSDGLVDTQQFYDILEVKFVTISCYSDSMIPAAMSLSIKSLKSLTKASRSSALECAWCAALVAVNLLERSDTKFVIFD